MRGERSAVTVVAVLVLIAAAAPVALAVDRHKEVVVYTPENDSDWKLKCSREKSRMVRRVLNEFVFPHLAKAQVNFTLSCPLATQRDVYYEHEANKQKFRASYWKSLYSNKIFKSEHFIDQHMENRHMDKIPATADVCLADRCDVFLCDEYALSFYEALGLPQKRMRSKFVKKPCDDGAMGSAQNECRRLLETCFRDLERPKLYEFFEQNVCSRLECKSFHTILPNLNSQRPDRYRVLYITFSVIVALILLSYYIVVFLTWSERRQRPDLRKRRIRKLN
ncbi:hypothetical protein HOP50_04g32960 [Chloropicon primus]|uniref:Uncharacterized protein n=1 Tax=Chloropicon primus TaxID=1764295 RepID=A0A5B8MLC4_9CHLO|nr:hypothetical protein A3770_04p32920 [Chloropicon primus]UPQ99986.1 hypothetical protein HOP50_04g32960 [Chloropicon primus]|mmetsp:Transcript_10496/g.29679  ORF Transcript_10496/g.29679 Transcript_10496/m.29679 type:complete len:279 (-) Transcript_10496:78-914(-)|eukprot:QDZ20774.1 hypothetical protein A3770_04p32920 [Chloropicon primus]